MRRRTTEILLLVFLVPSALSAQQDLLPLAKVVQKVVQRDPGILAQVAQQQAARSEARRAQTQRYPKLYLSTDTGFGKNVNDIANVLLTGLSPSSVTNPITRSRLANLSGNRPYVVPGARLEDNLYDGGRTQAAVRSAFLAENKAEVEKQKTTEDAASMTASYYLNLAEGQLLDKYLEEYTQIAQIAAKALKAQARVGRITDAEALAGQTKYQTSQAALENNRDDLRLWSDLLRRLAGLPSGATFDTRPLEAYLAAFRLSPMASEVDLSNNFDVQTSNLDARIQEQQLREAKSQRLPHIKFVAQYGFQFSNLLFTFRPGYNVGIEATYPLFTSGETERNILAERDRLRAATFKERKTREVLAAKYERVIEENRKIGRDLNAARNALAQGEEVYRVARLKYDQGAGSPSALLDAAELLLNSRERCIDLARSSLLLRWSVLESQGGLLAELERGALP